MNRSLSLSLVLLAAAWLTACRGIPESERFEYVKPADVARRVLLEDFTGQLCRNCPNAVADIERIHEAYGEEGVVVVSIHGGDMALYPKDLAGGLRTAAGDEYYRDAQIDGPPMGRIDRVGAALSPSQWQQAVSERISQPAPIDITFDVPWIESDTARLLVFTRSLYDDLEGFLQVWLVEDSITGAQVMPDGKANFEYLHRHVFRTAVNGTRGQAVSLKEGELQAFFLSAFLPAEWNPAHLTAVAFVYSSTGVQQVATAPLIHP